MARLVRYQIFRELPDLFAPTQMSEYLSSTAFHPLSGRPLSPELM